MKKSKKSDKRLKMNFVVIIPILLIISFITIFVVALSYQLTPLATYHDIDGDYSIENIRDLAVSSDGNYLFTSSYNDDYVSIMNITNKSEIIPLATYNYSEGDYSVESIYSLAVSSDGNYLFTSSYNDGYVSIMNITNKSEIIPLATYHDIDGDYSIRYIKDLAVSSDGNYLFTSSSNDDYVSIMNITNKSEIIPLATYYDMYGDYSVEYTNSLAVSSDGNYLFTSSYTDGYVSIMNITNKSEIIPLATYHDIDGDYSIENIRDLAVSSDGNYLFTSSSNDGYVSIMNITNKSEITPLATYYDSSGDYSIENIRDLAVSSDGNYLFTSSYNDGYVSIMEYGIPLDTTLPTYSDVSVSSNVVGSSSTFSILYNDDTALHPNGQYIFSTNNSGSWVNESTINLTSTPSWANVTKTLNAVEGTVVGYRWYVDDNVGNINNTEIFTLTTTPENTAPTIGSPTLNDYSPYTSDTLTCTNGSFTDSDGDSATWYYKWYDSGALISGQTSTTLDLTTSGLDKADTIICSTIASDGTVNATAWTNSSTATIQNTIPTVTAPALNSTTPITTDIISCNGGTFSDTDGDSESSREYRWYDSGVTIIGQTSQTLDLAISGLDKADTIICEIRVNDGIGYSTYINSSNTATIQNSLPIITTPQTNITIYTNGSVYLYDYNVTDLDGDTITWYDNTSIFNINDSTGLISNIPTELQAGNHTILISASDGDVNATDVFEYIIIDITPPTIYLINPKDGDSEYGQPVEFKVNLSENGSCSAEIYGLNYTMTTTDNRLFSYSRNLDIGSNSVIFYCSDDLNNSGSNTSSFDVVSSGSNSGGGDVISPTISDELANIEVETKILKMGVTNRINIRTLNEDNQSIDVDSIIVELKDVTSGKKEVKYLSTGEYVLELFLPEQDIINVTMTVIVMKDSQEITKDYTLDVEKVEFITKVSTTFENTKDKTVDWIKENQGLTILIIVSAIALLLLITAIGYFKKK